MTSPWRDGDGPISSDPRRTSSVFPAAAPAAEPRPAWWSGSDIDALLAVIARPLVEPAPVGDPALRGWRP